MCGRYQLAEENVPEALARVIDELRRRKTPDALKTAGEVFPTDVAPVLANSRRQTVRPFAMRWGYAVPGSRPVINARSETAASKPLFADGMKRRRCLIPASGYYEWRRHDGEKTKYAIRPAGSQTLYLAGLYRLEEHDGAVLPAFVILTRDAAPGISFIHARMPVILSADSARAWLDPANDAGEIIKSALTDMVFAPA